MVWSDKKTAQVCCRAEVPENAKVIEVAGPWIPQSGHASMLELQRRDDTGNYWGPPSFYEKNSREKKRRKRTWRKMYTHAHLAGREKFENHWESWIRNLKRTKSLKPSIHPHQSSSMNFCQQIRIGRGRIPPPRWERGCPAQDSVTDQPYKKCKH